MQKIPEYLISATKFSLGIRDSKNLNLLFSSTIDFQESPTSTSSRHAKEKPLIKFTSKFIALTPTHQFRIYFNKPICKRMLHF